MERLRELVGAERSVTAVSHALHLGAVENHVPITGAVLVTCSDEAEGEGARAFGEGFARYLVPPLKFGQREVFRVANPGAIYEWGAVRVAAGNYSAAGEPGERKLMVVKVNAHTGVVKRGDGREEFGVLHRYRHVTSCCAALTAAMSGRATPYNRLVEAFESEGADRVAALLGSGVDPHEHGLRAALMSARLQARKVVLDIQDFGCSHTNWVVVPCVSLNRSERNTEIMCGYYSAPDRSRPTEFEYVGVGDDPVAYQLTVKNRQILVTDAGSELSRPARNHRELLRERAQDVASDVAEHGHPGLVEARQAVSENKHKNAAINRALLSGLLVALGEVAPVPAALLLFANGVTGIHHVWKAHRIARDLSRTGDARAVLADLHEQLDHLTPDEREAIIELLCC